MGFLKEFKEFAVKGNALDMAVGVIIGGAFGKIITSLVNDIIMPPISALVGNTNFSDLKIDLSGVRDVAYKATSVLGDAVTTTGTELEPIYWRYGAFIQQVIDFTILAFCVFMMVKLVNRLARKKKEEPAPAPAPAPAPSAEEKLLAEIRDLLKEKR